MTKKVKEFFVWPREQELQLLDLQLLDLQLLQLLDCNCLCKTDRLCAVTKCPMKPAIYKIYLHVDTSETNPEFIEEH